MRSVISSTSKQRLELRDWQHDATLTVETEEHRANIRFFFTRKLNPSAEIMCDLAPVDIDLLLVTLAVMRGKKVVSAEFFEEAKKMLADPSPSIDAGTGASAVHNDGPH